MRLSALAAALVIGGNRRRTGVRRPIDPPGMLTFGVCSAATWCTPGRPVNGLVINLHGAGMKAVSSRPTTDYNSVADRYGFVVAYPNGIDSTWADGRGRRPDRQGGRRRRLPRGPDRATREPRLRHPARHVFVTGMSAGAFMANRLVCDRADLVTAIAPVAGTLGAGALRPSRPVSVMAVHGTADPVVPYGGGS